MNLAKLTIIIFSCCCTPAVLNPYPLIGAIPPPGGFRRSAGDDPFAAWLRTLPLKKDRTVHLFNGALKRNQEAQFAVLDVSVGTQDLQQCADAIMRLRAEFLYARKEYKAICFYTAQGMPLNFLDWTLGRRFRQKGGQLVAWSLPGHNPCEDRACFNEYLQTVFSYCGTLSLEKQLVPVPHFSDIRPGDVLITGGSPGHAMLVMDLAIDAAGHKAYLLAQSYMPAQDIHLVKNPKDEGASPWYRADQSIIITPEWTFYPFQLRRWPKNN
ncbi:DUF4846 domain-containing protein [Flavitalea sp. BT771]|uniref:DUF4846 domain-containing protein n=1 Tax=Flavitalea sp. BT771 TaxID=3063329 RepID=UPI0026E24A01|nr:DUF4846 domain-containing protein [Flavitalea sp. BT771]MDO6434634.1 DUF4846 domain-containing protein [Flavitalea sp. BT771]MDV6223534.1 DUF4846 domain-containing protein [Flavitalea sp. BT771]